MAYMNHYAKYEDQTRLPLLVTYSCIFMYVNGNATKQEDRRQFCIKEIHIQKNKKQWR